MKNMKLIKEELHVKFRDGIKKQSQGNVDFGDKKANNYISIY